MRGPDIIVINVFHPVTLSKILHEGDPSEWRKLQDRSGDQYRDASAILANQFLLKRRTSPEPEPFFMRDFVERYVFRGCQVGPVQPACLQILAAVSNQIKKSIVRLRNAIELARNDPGDGRLRRERPNTRTAAPQLFISFVTVAEVAHYSGETL